MTARCSSWRETRTRHRDLEPGPGLTVAPGLGGWRGRSRVSSGRGTAAACGRRSTDAVSPPLSAADQTSSCSTNNRDVSAAGGSGGRGGSSRPPKSIWRRSSTGSTRSSSLGGRPDSDLAGAWREGVADCVALLFFARRDETHQMTANTSRGKRSSSAIRSGSGPIRAPIYAFSWKAAASLPPMEERISVSAMIFFIR